jgi:hypothetical protein
MKETVFKTELFRSPPWTPLTSLDSVSLVSFELLKLENPGISRAEL